MFKSKKPLYVGAAMLAVVALFSCIFLPLHRQIRQKRELQEAVALEVRRGMEPYTQTEEYSTETIVLTQEDVELLAKAVYPLIDTQVTMDTTGATRQWTEEKLEHLEAEISEGVAQVISGNLVYDRENPQQSGYAEKLQAAITRNITMIVEEVLLQHLPEQEDASLEAIMIRDALDLNRMELEQSREDSMKKIRKLQEEIGMLQSNLTTMDSETASFTQVEEIAIKLGYLSEQYTELVNEYALQKNISFAKDLEHKESVRKLEEQAKEADQKLEEQVKETNQKLEEQEKVTNQKLEEQEKVTNQKLEEQVKETNQRLEEQAQGTAQTAKDNKEEILMTGRRLEEAIALLEGSLEDYQLETDNGLGNLKEDLKLTKENLARTNAFGEIMKLDLTLQKEEIDQKLADLKQATDESLINLQRATDQNLSDLQQVMNEKLTGMQQSTEERITGLQQSTEEQITGLQQTTDRSLNDLQQMTDQNLQNLQQDIQQNYLNVLQLQEGYYNKTQADEKYLTREEAAASTYTKGEIDSMLAPGYDPQIVYEIGSVIVKEGVMYECIVSPEGPEEWNPEHWQPITMMDLLSSGAGSDSYREMILVALSNSGLGLNENSDWNEITTALQRWFPATYDLLQDSKWINTVCTRGCFGTTIAPPEANRHSVQTTLSGEGDNRPYRVEGSARFICDRKMGFGGFKTLRIKGHYSVSDNNLGWPEVLRFQIYERADLSSPVLATLKTYELNGGKATQRDVSFDTYIDLSSVTVQGYIGYSQSVASYGLYTRSDVVITEMFLE